jgi:anti-anti-sigma factor
MSIRCDEYNGICVLTPGGDLAGDAAVDAQRSCDEQFSRPNPPSIVFDLTACEFIDSAGLEMLCRLRRRADEAGARVALARVGANAAKILGITRLAGRFDCHPELSGAVSAAR